MDQKPENFHEKSSILGRISRFKNFYLGIIIILAVILCAMAGGELWFSILFVALVFAAVFYPVPYLILVILLLIASVIGLLRSDKYDNTKLFYGSAFLYFLSIILGILYFVSPVIFGFISMMN